ncbi:MAG: Gfo/Idh/MocA family oxidoreductase [Planctomycetota bacterium]|nr:Gfo/Idh/MocA family oxidoreductase [Planctomycetota bacterium]
MPVVSLAGCGHIHTPGFIKKIKARTDTQVKYVWDHDAARAKKNADELGNGAAVVSDPKQLWSDAAVQGVVVCSETNRHEDLVLPAAAAKKHLFVEKPLGMGAKDAYAMADAIEKAGVIFQTGYFQRGSPVHRFVREEIQKGTFGKVTRVRGSNCHSGSLGGWFDTDWRWMADPKIAGCGAYGDLGTHSLDILMWLMGDVAECTAALDNGTARYPGCDELGEGLLRFQNGAIGTLAAGWVDVANPVSFLVSGTEGHAVVANGQFFFVSKKVEGADGKQPWTKLPEAWPHAFDLYLDAVGGKADVPLVGAREAAKRSAVMEALYEGARTKAWVKPA